MSISAPHTVSAKWKVLNSSDCVVMFITVVDIYYLLLIAPFLREQCLLLACMEYYSFVRLLKCIIILLSHCSTRVHVLILISAS